MKSLHRSALAIAVAVTWVACHQNDRSGSKNSTETTTQIAPSPILPPSNENQKQTDVRAIGGGPIDPAARSDEIAAIRKIAAARCDRESRCNNVGSARKFATRADCLTTMASYKLSHINFDKCPLGVAEPKVETCVQIIGAEDCSTARALNRIDACRVATLCTQR